MGAQGTLGGTSCLMNPSSISLVRTRGGDHLTLHTLYTTHRVCTASEWPPHPLCLLQPTNTATTNALPEGKEFPGSSVQPGTVVYDQLVKENDCNQSHQIILSMCAGSCYVSHSPLPLWGGETERQRDRDIDIDRPRQTDLETEKELLKAKSGWACALEL